VHRSSAQVIIARTRSGVTSSTVIPSAAAKGMLATSAAKSGVLTPLA
jgi:hypothetical protein